jgi:hypothetical protein
VESSIQPFDFLHPATPPALVAGVARASEFLERLPLVREFTGSFLVVGRKPEDRGVGAAP